MNDTWTTHHTGTYEGRKAEVKTYSEGGYRVSTTQAEDDPGSVSGDGSSTIIIPPTEAGRPIDIDGESIAEVRNGLVQDAGFSAAAADEIVGYFPA